MRKQTGRDHMGPGMNVHGYDLATQLGSTLCFTQQSASVRSTDAVEIVANNFGFDPDGGVNAVALDMKTEHYWMQVRKK